LGANFIWDVMHVGVARRQGILFCLPKIKYPNKKTPPTACFLRCSS